MGKAEKPADRPVSQSPYVYSLVSLSRITLYKYKFYKSAFPFVKETCVLEKKNRGKQTDILVSCFAPFWFDMTPFIHS